MLYMKISPVEYRLFYGKVYVGFADLKVPSSAAKVRAKMDWSIVQYVIKMIKNLQINIPSCRFAQIFA